MTRRAKPKKCMLSFIDLTTSTFKKPNLFFRNVTDKTEMSILDSFRSIKTPQMSTANRTKSAFNINNM